MHNAYKAQSIGRGGGEARGVEFPRGDRQKYFKTLWEKIFTDRMLKIWNPERLWHSRYL